MAARPVPVATPDTPAPHVLGSARGVEQVWDGAVPGLAGMAVVPVRRAGVAPGSHSTPARSQVCTGRSGAFPAALQAWVLRSGWAQGSVPPAAGKAAEGCGRPRRSSGARFPSPQVLRSLNRTYKNMKQKPVSVDLDPKAVTCDELFGVIHPSTREWKDGETPTLVHVATRVVAYPRWDLAQTIFQQLLVHRQIPS